MVAHNCLNPMDESCEQQVLRLFTCSIAAGFPSAAEGYEDTPLNLQEWLVPRPTATFFMRASGDAMRSEGIPDGAILVVDRSLRSKHGGIVVATVDDELVVRRLHRRAGHPPQLHCGSARHAPIVLDGERSESAIWGVVTAVVIRMG